jgi:hypothetical protein
MQKRFSQLAGTLALAGLFCLYLAGCAGLRDDARGGSSGGDSGMRDTPCEECGARGEIELKITDEKSYREWNAKAYSRMDSSAVVGVFPTLRVKATHPEVCKMCHSFSADALDFDLARVEDSLFVKAFPKMKRELMLPGMRLPDADSLYIDSLSVKLLNSAFADGKKLADLSPWAERDGIEQAFEREVPAKLKDLLAGIASRYEVRYLSLPLVLEVNMDPDLGRSGGYTWKIAWSLWDARYGELVFLTYSEFTAATTSRVAPEKEWASPFAPRLWKMFSTDITKLESH